MKKSILALSLALTLGTSTQANILDGLFDFAQLTKSFLAFSGVINANLEKVRLIQNKNLDVREQWDLTYEVAQSLNQSTVALNKLFGKYKLNQETCLPITAFVNYQIEFVKNCQNFYSKPVPDNAEILMNKFTGTLLQSRILLNKCYPSLKGIKIPGLP
jgi:hypothetical protein